MIALPTPSCPKCSVLDIERLTREQFDWLDEHTHSLATTDGTIVFVHLHDLAKLASTVAALELLVKSGVGASHYGLWTTDVVVEYRMPQWIADLPPQTNYDASVRRVAKSIERYAKDPVAMQMIRSGSDVARRKLLEDNHGT